MLIESVLIRNFRSIREVEVSCDELMILIGRNGSGKSCFLKAIDLFYSLNYPISEEDFYNRDTETPIEIQLTFQRLRSEEIAEFQPYVQNEKLTVVKKITLDERGRPVIKYYGVCNQIPEFAEVRASSNKTELRAQFNALVTNGVFAGLETTVRSADDAETRMLEYESTHPELTQPTQKEAQFFGEKNVGGGKLDKYTRFVFVPAVRDAADETGTSKSSSLRQLIELIAVRKIEARPDIQEFRTDFQSRAETLYSRENLTELPSLGEELSAILTKFSPGARLDLYWDTVSVPDIPIPNPNPILYEDNFGGSIERKGHGLQRALVMTLLQHLATTGREEEQEPARGPDLILAIEEPELFLHPSRCRHMASVLSQLTFTSEEDEPGSRNQVLYATHSPLLIDISQFDQIRMVRKSPVPGEDLSESDLTAFTLQEASQQMAQIWEGEPDKFTRDSFRARALPVMNSIVNEGFFSDVAVVVEGLSDLGMLWKLQEIKDLNWTELGITIVSAGGKKNIDRPVVIFRGLEIPTYFVFDGDASLKAKQRKDAIKCNRGLQRLADQTDILEFPETTVESTWAVFEDNLETECRQALGKDVYDEIRELVADEYQDKPSAIMKNAEGAARFIELVYNEKGLTIPVLERIVEAVTKLGTPER